MKPTKEQVQKFIDDYYRLSDFERNHRTDRGWGLYTEGKDVLPVPEIVTVMAWLKEEFEKGPKMRIQYTFISQIDIVWNFLTYAHQIIALYQKEDWWDNTDTMETLNKIIINSHAFLIAKDVDSNEIIGFARIISDKVSDGFIQDVTVKKEYRGQGIAKHMLKLLVAKAKEDDLTRLFLIAERGTANLYKHVGFQVCETDVSMELFL